MKEPLRRTDIVFSEKDRMLRADVRRLGRMVGDLLKEQSGVSLYDTVETARKLSIRRRDADLSASGELTALLKSLSADEAQNFVRAFSTYFQVVNTAEKVHRIRRRREYLRDESIDQPQGLHATFHHLQHEGVERSELEELLHTIRIQPVFTAHPTEPTRRTILRKEQNIVRQMVSMLDPSMTPQELGAAEANIRSELTSSWQTEEHPSEHMAVSDELEHVLFFLTDVLYRVIPAFYESIDAAMNSTFGEGASERELPIVVRFASWVGGDMDGNPEVSAKTIRTTLARQRSLILNLYYEECGKIAAKLSQTTNRIGITTDVTDRIVEYRHYFPDAMHAVTARHRDMPYRVLLRLIQARLQSTYDDGAYVYENADEFEADIRLIERSLTDNQGRHAGLFAVNRLLIRIRSFGFHLASLDVRQDAMLHRNVVAACLGEDDWNDKSIEYRVERICEALENNEAPLDTSDTVIRKTLAVFQAISYCKRRYGHRSIGLFVISMTQGPDDILSVLLLARWGELVTRRGRVPLDIAPLLETVRDLSNGPDIMHQLLTNPTYREHLKHCRSSQLIMIGYSDSNKDGGIAASRWALYKAQGDLVEELERENIDITLFHGRGGTISRGGGSMRSAVLGAPPGTINGRMRVTEQGEIINEKYGLRGIALRTLEQALSSVAVASHRETGTTTPIPDAWPTMMSTVANESRAKYRALVYESPDFFEYFRAGTPIDIIEQMQIGSRPASRRAQNGIEDLRAIPWVFSWTQSRHILPGWYGLGTGLAAAIGEYGEQTFADMLTQWHFAKALLADAEMVLAKSDLDIASMYSRLAGDLHNQFFADIQAEHVLTTALIQKLTGHEHLLDADRVVQRAIMLRNPYVDPMSILQVDLLKRWRETDRQDEKLREVLFATVNGIAQGLQNTG